MQFSKVQEEQSAHPSVRLYPVEPAESPTLTAGTRVGKHRIQDISDEFIPETVRRDKFERPIAIPDGDFIRMAQRLAGELGLGVGISSGCNFLAAIHAQEALGSDSLVATVFPDDNKKYLTTDLMGEEIPQESHLSPLIELCAVSDLSERAVHQEPVAKPGNKKRQRKSPAPQGE